MCWTEVAASKMEDGVMNKGMFLVSRGWDKQRLGLFHWNLQRGKPLSPFQLSQYMCLSSDL